MNMELSRRTFLKGARRGVLPERQSERLDLERPKPHTPRRFVPFKLAGTTETRNTCTYCAVGCGIIMYSKGNLAKGEKADIIHIEGDVDHPTNRGTLCPKGAALLETVHAETRLKYPMLRKPARTSSSACRGMSRSTASRG